MVKTLGLLLALALAFEQSASAAFFPQTTVTQSSGTNLHVNVDSAPSTTLGSGSSVVGKVGIDQTTPGTTNGVQVNAALPAGTNVIGKVSIDQTTPGTTNGVQVNAALPAGSNTIGSVKVTDGTNNATIKAASTAPVATDTAQVVAISPNTPPVATKSPLNSTASASTTATITTTATSITAATNSVEVLVQANDTNSANLRVSIGTTCSSSLGIQLQPGRSETFHTSQNLSVCSESGTQTVNVQWLAQ